jgi:hypothetical protein
MIALFCAFGVRIDGEKQRHLRNSGARWDQGGPEVVIRPGCSPGRHQERHADAGDASRPAEAVEELTKNRSAHKAAEEIEGKV